MNFLSSSQLLNHLSNLDIKSASLKLTINRSKGNASNLSLRFSSFHKYNLRNFKDFSCQNIINMSVRFDLENVHSIAAPHIFPVS